MEAKYKLKFKLEDAAKNEKEWATDSNQLTSEAYKIKNFLREPARWSYQ